MAKLLEFTFNHWLLVIAFVLVLLAILYEEFKKKLFAKHLLTAQQLVDIINKGNPVLLDIRDNKKFKTGYIVNSLNVPLVDLTKKIASLSKYNDSEIVIISEIDTEAEKAFKILQENKFLRVFVLDAGIKAWKNSNYPLTSK